MKKTLFCMLSIAMVLLAACGGSEPEAQPEVGVAPVSVAPATDTPLPPPPPTPQPPAEQAVEATPASETETSSGEVAVPTLTPEPDWLNTYGRTADDLMYLGNPNAPVTMIDFSDFM